MIFLTIIGGGLFGGFAAVKCKVLQVWIFLISTVFSVYFAFLAAPAVMEMLKDIKAPPVWKSCGTVIILFIAFMIVFCKISNAVAGEVLSVDLPEIAEKAVNFVLGSCSGMIFAGIFILCLTSFIPALQGDNEETRLQRKTSLQNVARNLLTPGNILTFTAGRGEKQWKHLEISFPFFQSEMIKQESGDKKEDAGEEKKKMQQDPPGRKTVKKTDKKNAAEDGMKNSRKKNPRKAGDDIHKEGRENKELKKDEEDIRNILAF